MFQIKTMLLVASAVVAGCRISNAQLSLSGQVKTEKGDPVPFALVALKNTQLSVLADVEGNFKFKNLVKDQYVLVTRSLGYSEKIDTLDLTGDQHFDPRLKVNDKQLDEVVVKATRVDKNSGMAFNNIDGATINKQNLGQDAPYILNQLPNVVINSDAGNGVGYTGLRIRGSDGTRINVTINGVPVNDAESQGTYYVDMPDFLSGVNNIQVQRGVGASSNGAGAFGATINFQTNQFNDKAYAKVISTAGSFDTYRNTLSAGTGLLNGKYTLDARASNITSQGYIDRAASNLQSYYISAAYYGKKDVLKFINFLGQEKTYQAWNYVLEDSIKKGNRTYNSCGEYIDENGHTKYYKNETDNYKQNNFQLHYVRQVNARLNFNLTAHYTKGKGYYEQYKQGQSFSAYNAKNLVTPKGDTITQTDLIRRLWLDNDFAGGIFNFNYTASSKLAITLGGGYNTYYGKHFGRVMWASYAPAMPADYQYYLNSANKNDGNLYLKLNYKVSSKLNVFVDLQQRFLNYRFEGFDDSLKEKVQDKDYSFFNPKAGLSYDLNKRINLYASIAVANKEPNRDDFVQSSPKSRPRPEHLTDFEAGIKYLRSNFLFNANFYNMQYKDQLVLNGQINNVGAYNRVNVASSYRRGTELEMNWSPAKYLALGGNVALSQNKIVNFTEYIDSSDAAYTIYTQYKKEHKNTDISFSPNLVSSMVLTLKPAKDLEISFIHKNVGRQYLDNTSNKGRSIQPYSVLDARVNYKFKTRSIPEIALMLGVYNLLSAKYQTNGYTFSYYTDDKLYTFNYLAPAAPINFLAGVSFKFF